MKERITYAILDSAMQQQSTVIINGQPQGGKQVKVYFVKCKDCGRILAQFNPGESIQNIITYCKEKLAKEIIYCPACGNKLIYSMDILNCEN